MRRFLFLLVSVLIIVGCSNQIGRRNHIDLSKKNIVEQTTGSLISTELTTVVEVIDYRDFKEENDLFELPINGSTGYPMVNLNIREAGNQESAVIGTIEAGMPFTIVSEDGDWWLVEFDGISGYVYHHYCMINLPDVIPSIIYENTNSDASLLRTSEFDIPNITGQRLYDSFIYSERYDEYQYAMPVLYATAKKIDAIQKSALLNGETLILYEGFRPRATQLLIVENMQNLIKAKPNVETQFTRNGWDLAWFINTGLSNHQLGIAIDVSLGKVKEVESRYIGNYHFKDVTEYTEYEMPTKIHDLSIAATTFTKPVPSLSKTEWLNATLSEKMNEYAVLLQRYCVEVGLTPLASEWWHFNDLDSYSVVKSTKADGNFFVLETKSKIPD